MLQRGQLGDAGLRLVGRHAPRLAGLVHGAAVLGQAVAGGAERGAGAPRARGGVGRGGVRLSVRSVRGGLRLGERPVDGGDQVGGRRAVHVEHELGEAVLPQSGADVLQRDALGRGEQHAAAARGQRRHEVDDRLGLARAGRTVQQQVRADLDGVDRGALAGVGVDDDALLLQVGVGLGRRRRGADVGDGLGVADHRRDGRVRREGHAVVRQVTDHGGLGGGEGRQHQARAHVEPGQPGALRAQPGVGALGRTVSSTGGGDQPVGGDVDAALAAQVVQQHRVGDQGGGDVEQHVAAAGVGGAQRDPAQQHGGDRPAGIARGHVPRRESHGDVRRAQPVLALQPVGVPPDRPDPAQRLGEGVGRAHQLGEPDGVAGEQLGDAGGVGGGQVERARRGRLEPQQRVAPAELDQLAAPTVEDGGEPVLGLRAHAVARGAGHAAEVSRPGSAGGAGPVPTRSQVCREGDTG